MHSNNYYYYYVPVYDQLLMHHQVVAYFLIDLYYDYHIQIAKQTLAQYSLIP